ncbi:DsbA family oxidoreductase [Aliiruegeria sabulilitoris]|uniref:DsbA family oxidoreductase n=1 Tax=Aliiruegeria sabulilitoris TaxID=1510458 RepID=UPI0008304085|nr:DsbA family oxidoreductase [Aliiruegeria sabulilitoris]NDR58174.1 DsbA family oxidoreductase [Pseudoruegeria sp. M32A2M]
MIKLDILSDPICPWCYIGKTLLFSALEQRPDHGFEIEWHPFQLNPDMPKAGMDRREYLETKFGGKQQAVEVYSRIAEAAESAGLKIDFAAIQRTPNTLDAHRLIHWAGLEGRQTEVVQSLFDAYFLQGRDIGDRDVLADLADSAGLDAAVIRRLLDGDADAEDIRARDANARERGVTGVPTFIIANQHVVPGAQQPDLWIRLVDEISGQLGSKP